MTTTVGIEAHQNKTSSDLKTSAEKYGNDKRIVSLLFTIAKKATLFNVIYLVGYMNWSVAWLITPMILIETHKYLCINNGSKQFVRKFAKESTTTNEKDVLLTSIKDLPSWVIIKLLQ